VGRTAVDKRLFVRAVLWVLRSGMRWQDMPERFGRYKSVHKRFPR
jgi:transposase